MKITGIVLLVIGLIWGIMAFNIDTSVEVGGKTFGAGEYSIHVPKTRVNNIGLINEKQNHIIGAGLTLIIGVIFFIVGILREEKIEEKKIKPLKKDTPQKRKIPEHAIAFSPKEETDFSKTCEQLLSKYKSYGFERIIVNTLSQFMIQKQKDSYIKVIQQDNGIFIESKNSPKIDLPIIHEREPYKIEKEKKSNSKPSKKDTSVVTELTNLVELKKSGAITVSEYENLKSEIMNNHNAQ